MSLPIPYVNPSPMTAEEMLSWAEAKLRAGLIEAPDEPGEQTDAEAHGAHEMERMPR